VPVNDAATKVECRGHDAMPFPRHQTFVEGQRPKGLDGASLRFAQLVRGSIQSHGQITDDASTNQSVTSRLISVTHQCPLPGNSISRLMPRGDSRPLDPQGAKLV
jgi:hypothetical protein